ncbi:LysR substrate-binding domain-containing protein [Shewanella sp. A32]|uniref:LysR substrate-binding domain-containing protein n=1 Tax=Shewanella sp. A32 TaxID=3031327 RepID=UPI0023B9B293|nr:LysR substrate-binding domain-containing protein [Shewanella sp. A32]MDF0535457.1 LysR substrate-binding domain-containing protein [Shewanella sp. A32]
MNHWEGICEFIAVAESQSFTQAATRLNVSTAQVSRQVSALEKRLATKLFYRTTRKVTLSEEGTLYYRHCRALQDGIEKAERTLGSLKQEPQGLLRLTAPVTYGEQFVLPLLNDFLLKYHKLQLDLELTNKTLDLIEGGFDLAIRLGNLTDSSLMARKLATRCNYVCASPNYLSQYGVPHSLSELQQHQCLVGNHPYWRFKEQGQERTWRVNGRLQCNSGIGLRDAARKGLGLVQLPDYYVHADLQHGTLVTVLEHYRAEPEGVWGLYPQNRHLSPKVSLLLDWLQQGLSKDTATPATFA